MYVCTYIRMFCMYVRMYVHTYVCSVCMYVYILYTPTYKLTYACTYVCSLLIFSPCQQRRGGEVDVSTDKRGLLWILDEESIFPGATDQSFLERLQIYHGRSMEEHTASGTDCSSTCE